MGVLTPLVITGPTAAGKSALALRVARHYGAVIVAMDAMTVYRGFDIGTAKPSAAERDPQQGGVEHRCIDVVAPTESFTAQDFAQAVQAEAGPVVLCGGSTFYLRAWEQPLVASPATDPALRAELEALPDPHALLRERDPVLAERLHPNDRVRITRGLEYLAQTGQRLSDAHASDPKTRRACTVVWVDRDDLYERIDERVDSMMGAGYLDEVRALLAAGVPEDCKPMQSLGYKHLAAHLRDAISLDEAVRLTKRDSRHFARRQRGFLRGRCGAPAADPWAEVQRAWGA